MIQVLLFWVECLIVLMVFNLGIWVIGFNFKRKEVENGFFQYWFLLNCIYQLIFLIDFVEFWSVYVIQI